MPPSRPTFDEYGKAYDAALGPGIRMTGATRQEYARLRIRMLRDCCPLPAGAVRTILDFGCGTGTHVPALLQAFPLAAVDGVDVSEVSLEIAAKELLPHPRIRLARELPGDRSYDLTFMHGVIHHIPSRIRTDVLRRLASCCQKYVVVSENNPYNPLMYMAMKLAPMDAHAEPITIAGCRRLLASVGLKVVKRTYLFHLPPRVLQRLPGLGRRLLRVPMGSQYMLFAAPVGSGHGTERM